MPFALDSSPELNEISEAINYLLANFSTGVTADPNTGQVMGPTGNILSYLYKYLAVKYADTFDGSTNFSNTPTNRFYYGLRNTDDPVESTNPADYIWYKVDGGFGTTKFLWYQTGGGRQVDFAVDTVAPNSYFVQAPTDSIDLDVVTGNSGKMYATPTIYKWTSTSTAPARPTTTSTYTWATATINSVPSTWSSSIPAAPGAGYYLWSIIIPLIESINVTTSNLDWTNTSYAITAVGITGATGSTGPRTSTGYVYYQLASTTAPAAPTLSGFNFVTGQFSTISSNWSTSFNAPSATDTTKFWAVYYSVSEATFGGTQTVTVSTVFNWTNFNGLVTFTNLATNTGTTFIDGGNITTNTINVNRLIAGLLQGYTLRTGSGGHGPNGFVFEVSSSGVVWTDNLVGGVGYFANSYSTGTLPLQSYSYGNIEGFIGAISASGSGGGNAHGIRGANYKASTTTSGLVGAANGYDFYADGSGTNYGPFTGTHDSLVPIGSTFEVGDIVVDQQIIERNGISSTIALVAGSNTPNQQGVLGVVCALPSPLDLQKPSAFIESITEAGVVMKPSFYPACDVYNFMPINAVGEGQINVCGENGDISIGDLIVSSSTVGKGMKQADDVVRSYTVAKSRESVTFSSPSEIKQIACIYLGG
jgi:hypothetical protein